MQASIGVRELRQNLSRYLTRVKAGETFVVTERGRGVARLVPFSSDAYAELATRFGATTPTGRLETVAGQLRAPGLPAGSTDDFLGESRGERCGE
jgi:prevent-host-death family protein